jgi:hypothetical protein
MRPPPELLWRPAAAAQSPAVALYGPVPGEYDWRQAYAAHLSGLYAP